MCQAPLSSPVRDSDSGSLVECGNKFPLLDAKKARNARYVLLSRLARNVWKCTLPMHQARHCSARSIPATTRKKDGTRVPTGMPGAVEIHSREEGTKHNYHGLGRCASALVCPVCSAIIQPRRAAEVMKAGEYLLAHGFQVAMLTQTASHSRATSLEDFVKRFQTAQKDMKKHRQYQNWLKETGARFTIRAVEVTDDNPDIKGGRKSGWHFHTHTLIFFEREKAFTEKEVKKYTAWLQQMWVKALNGVGLDGSLERAAKLDLPRATRALDTARAEGQDSADVQKLCAYISKAFGWEVSGGRNKKGRDAGRRVSVWELQEAALTDRPDLLPRYAEYMRAVKGLAWLSWSHGLRAFCGLDEEKTDKEVVEEGTIGQEIVWQFTDKQFRSVARFGQQGKLLDAADNGGKAGIADALDTLKKGHDIETGEELNE